MSDPGMEIDIMTLFPEVVDAVMSSSVIGKAAARGLIRVTSTNIRDYSPTANRRTDDYPYGGGMGLVMLAEPLYLCHRALCDRAEKRPHTVLMSAQGQPFTQDKAREFLARGHIIIVCGHYEGIDERFIRECVDEEISIGDFVMTGGEIPAMAVADAVCRLVPGVLSDESCFTDESHWSGLLEYPQYTRPEIWRGRAVPEVLLSGHHVNIERWRRRQSLIRTLRRRPQMMKGADLSPEDMLLLSEIMNSGEE